MPIGVSIREFARRAGCDEKVVRRKVESGHLKAFQDGSLNPEHVQLDWRAGVSAPLSAPDEIADTADTSADSQTAAPETTIKASPPQGDDVENVIRIENRAFFTKAVAERSILERDYKTGAPRRASYGATARMANSIREDHLGEG